MEAGRGVGAKGGESEEQRDRQRPSHQNTEADIQRIQQIFDDDDDAEVQTDVITSYQVNNNNDNDDDMTLIMAMFTI